MRHTRVHAARNFADVARGNGERCEILLQIFHSDVREYEPGRLYVVLCSELTENLGFSGSKTRLQSRAWNE